MKVPTYEVKNLEAVYKIVNLSHEAFHEDDLGQTDAHVLELCRERLHLWKIVKLHGSGEVKKHVRQVWTLVGELVENCVSYELDR